MNPFELKMQEEKARKEAERLKKKENDKKHDPFIQKTSYETVEKPLAPLAKKNESISFFKPKEEMKTEKEEVKAPPAIVKPEVAPVEEEKKQNQEINKDTKPAETQGGEEDFKKSLAAMIGRGKPGAKRSTVVVKP